MNSNEGKLRLRWRQSGVGSGHPSFATGLDDTPENRRRLEPLRKLVGACVEAGKDPKPYLEEALSESRKPEVQSADSLVDPENTVEGYYRNWIREQDTPAARRSRIRDYKRHMETYVLPALGRLPLASLQPKELRGLRAELLATKSQKTGELFSEKYVKNILKGSFVPMLRQAQEDGLLLCDPTKGLKWERLESQEPPDPFEAEERDQLLAYFKTKLYGVHNRRRAHPAFHAYVFFLFWHGARPSEASGLRWRDIDLKEGTAKIRQSYHLGHYGKPKTKSARRTIELHPEMNELLKQLQPLKVTPDTPVFLNTEGNVIEPGKFSERWYAAQRALGIRVRGLYCTKDTFVTHSLATNREEVMLWLVRQTGVAFETLRRHYDDYMPKRHGSMYAKLVPALQYSRKAG